MDIQFILDSFYKFFSVPFIEALGFLVVIYAALYVFLDGRCARWCRKACAKRTR